MVDPNVHATLLAALTTTAGEVETLGQRFQQVIADELDDAIKELSSCLLYPNGPVSELRDCVQRFEKALEHMQTAQQNMDLGISRLQQLDAQFPTH